MYELKKLNPRVVDIAIAIIKSGKERYTCNALAQASSAIHKKGTWVNDQYVSLHRLVHHEAVYKNDLDRPTWWNSVRPCKASRIKALEATKARIIKENTK